MTIIIGLRFAECLLCIKLHVDKHFAWIALLESSQLQRGDDYYPHFTDEETKPQTGETTGISGICTGPEARATGQETLAVGWALAAVLVLKTLAAAERSPRTPHRRAEAFADLGVQELKAVHDFLRSRKELNLESPRALTMAKNYVFLVGKLLPSDQI